MQANSVGILYTILLIYKLGVVLLLDLSSCVGKACEPPFAACMFIWTHPHSKCQMIQEQKGRILLPFQTTRDQVNNHKGNNEIALLRNGIGQRGTRQDFHQPIYTMDAEESVYLHSNNSMAK